jgi:sulfite reductase beta subunit-like hemoprotein
MFIGGDFEGTRLNTKILDRVPYENIAEVLDVLFAKYRLEKNDGEGFGDFAERKKATSLAKLVESSLGEKYKWAKAEVV